MAPEREAPMDERLATLLRVEQQLEARVREREAAATAGLEAARAALKAARAGPLPGLEEAAAAEAAEDEAAHAAALAGVEAERRAALATFEQIDDARIDALARRALDRVLGGGSS